MGTGLSLVEQSEEFKESGTEPRVSSYWSGRLEEWLAAVLPSGAYERYEHFESDDTDPDDGDGPGDDETLLEWTERRRAGVQAWSFPTDELRAEYLQTVSSRHEVDVLALLRLFLFDESCFGGDSEHLHQAIYVHEDLSALDYLPPEYRRRLMMWMGGNAKPHPSIRWALDLLPHAPQQAIDAITGYLNVYRMVRPEGRSQGLLDAAAIIRARWVDDLSTGAGALFRLSPRELEVLVAALYKELGYSVELTPPSRDGGRDVIAVRKTPGQCEVVEIECKTHTSPVGVRWVRQLRGVIDRHGANRGVLVAISRFTRGAYKEASDDSRLEVIDGTTLIKMLNASFGPLWIEDREWICRGLV
ncbi:restriction endonuclease [Actinomadura geliboluensis]|uniref:restriction endonuclease n=1 Tax=Actinomadura geliboluensis TaxID=882440 RepID=UPI0037214AB9